MNNHQLETWRFGVDNDQLVKLVFEKFMRVLQSL